MATYQYNSGRLKPIQPRVGKDFKVRCLPRRPAPFNDHRPPWDNDMRATTKAFLVDKRTICKTLHVEVLFPDYTCFKASRYSLQGNKAVPTGEALLMRRNYRIPPWCNPKIHTKPVKHCTEIQCGKFKDFDVDEPNNYRNMYFDENAMKNVYSQSEKEKRKAYIYVPVPADNQKELDKSEDMRVFYESTQAKIFKKDKSQPVKAYRRLPQYALITGQENSVKENKEQLEKKTSDIVWLEDSVNSTN